ncbi:MAG: hypothetical protein R3291_05670, partial [Thermoplasmata archaeon]|nr:hypothetical protein [Thermoplasmata archaeon]
MVFSAFVAVTSLADASGEESAIPETTPPVVIEAAEDIAIEAAKPITGPLVGLNREQIRAWAEKFVPSAQLAVPSPEMQAALQLEKAGGGGTFVPDDLNEVMQHKSDLVHGMGFDGTDVTVAIIDTGLDFAHPDLYSLTYRVLDTGSPYYLHPMVYDGASLNDYLVFGEPGPNSWFVNTTYSTTVVEFNATRWVNWTDGMTNLSWNVTDDTLKQHFETV